MKWLMLGLGNPGTVYERTRHNVGFLSLEGLVRSLNGTLRKAWLHPYRSASGYLETAPCLFVQPLTYMNRSGLILPRLMRRYNLDASSLVVFCDNMDLPTGAIRVRKGGGTAGHRGIASVQQHLDSNEFIRIYIGIGRPERGVSVVDHVLGVPHERDEQLITQGIRRAEAAAAALVQFPLERVYDEFNRKDAHPAAP